MILRIKDYEDFVTLLISQSEILCRGKFGQTLHNFQELA